MSEYVDETPKKKGLMAKRQEEYGGDYHVNQSRDYALSNAVKCECTSCHVNKNGCCEVPALINIGPGGNCKTGQACIEARRKK